MLMISSWYGEQDRPAADALAKVVVVAATFALLEEDRHALGHVDAEKFVEVGDERGRRREDDGLGDAMAGEMLAPERCDLEIVLDDEGAVEALIDEKRHRSVVSSPGRMIVWATDERTPKTPMMMNMGISK
jgi:hypothetical protein